MSTLDCGIFMGFYPWIHGCGVLFFIVGKLFELFPFMVCAVFVKLWFSAIEAVILKSTDVSGTVPYYCFPGTPVYVFRVVT